MQSKSVKCGYDYMIGIIDNCLSLWILIADYYNYLQQLFQTNISRLKTKTQNTMARFQRGYWWEFENYSLEIIVVHWIPLNEIGAKRFEIWLQHYPI